MIEVNLNAAVDVGNNEQVLMEDGLKYFQPSAIQRTDTSPFTDEDDLSYAVKNIFNRLVVGISTTNEAVKNGLYLVGNLAVSGDGSHTEMVVGEEKKINSPVPYVMTMGMLAARGVQKAFEKDPTLSEQIKLKVNMTTGLPVLEWNKEEGDKFAKNFSGHTYNIMVYLGYGKAVSVEFEFEHIKVSSEASTTTFSLQVDEEGNVREGDIFAEFNNENEKILKEYYGLSEIDGNFFDGKKILHTDIGDGTTDLVVTDGIKPVQKDSIGVNRGVGHVINRNLDEIAEILGLSVVMRHNVSKILKDEASIQAKRKRKRIIEAMETSLKEEAEKIKNIIGKQLTKVQNEIDVVVVYGGGSILLKDYLKPILIDECSKREIPVLYIPAEYASTLYIEGLYFLLNSPLFNPAKKEVEAAAKEAAATK